MEPGNHSSSLIEKLLRSERSDNWNSAEINRLCDVIRQTSFEIHKFLRSGHLERVYENALAHRLTKIGIEVFQQHPLEVSDEDGTLLGHLCADLFVAKKLII